MYTSLLYETEGPVVTITLNRPDVLNALNTTLKGELVSALRAADADPAIHAVILTGAGTRAFCAGQDLSEAADLKAGQEGRDWARGFKEFREGVRGFMKPLVSAVNGWAVGAGFSLCMLTDIVIASTAARFKMSEIDVGLPCLNGTATLWPIVGRSRAVAHVLLGDEISAEKAREEGIVYRVVEPGELVNAAGEIARQLAAKAPDAVRENKLWFNALTQQLHDMSTQAAMEAHSRAFGSRTQKEAMSRFKKA